MKFNLKRKRVMILARIMVFFTAATCSAVWNDSIPEIEYTNSDVGIGTSNPTANLEVYDPNHSIVHINGTKYSMLRFLNNDQFKWAIYYHFQTGNLRFTNYESSSRVKVEMKENGTYVTIIPKNIYIVRIVPQNLKNLVFVDDTTAIILL